MILPLNSFVSKDNLLTCGFRPCMGEKYNTTGGPRLCTFLELILGKDSIMALILDQITVELRKVSSWISFKILRTVKHWLKFTNLTVLTASYNEITVCCQVFLLQSRITKNYRVLLTGCLPGPLVCMFRWLGRFFLLNDQNNVILFLCLFGAPWIAEWLWHLLPMQRVRTQTLVRVTMLSRQM